MPLVKIAPVSSPPGVILFGCICGTKTTTNPLVCSLEP